MSKRAEQYELDERAKARARVNQSPITEATDAHSMAKTGAGSTRISNIGLDARSFLLATITEEEVQRRNDAAYNQVLAILNHEWLHMKVKRRFDQSQ
jgi:hypothetical protein